MKNGRPTKEEMSDEIIAPIPKPIRIRLETHGKDMVTDKYVLKAAISR